MVVLTTDETKEVTFLFQQNFLLNACVDYCPSIYILGNVSQRTENSDTVSTTLTK